MAWLSAIELLWFLCTVFGVSVRCASHQASDSSAKYKDAACGAWCQGEHLTRANVEVCGGRARRVEMARRFRPSAPLSC